MLLLPKSRVQELDMSVDQALGTSSRWAWRLRRRAPTATGPLGRVQSVCPGGPARSKVIPTRDQVGGACVI